MLSTSAKIVPPSVMVHSKNPVSQNEKWGLDFQNKALVIQ